MTEEQLRNNDTEKETASQEDQETSVEENKEEVAFDQSAAEEVMEAQEDQLTEEEPKEDVAFDEAQAAEIAEAEAPEAEQTASDEELQVIDEVSGEETGETVSAEEIESENSQEKTEGEAPQEMRDVSSLPKDHDKYNGPVDYNFDSEYEVQTTGSSRASKSSKATVKAETTSREVAHHPTVTQKPKKKRWYIVHTYSGHENKVKVNLEKRTEFMNMGDKIFRVEVPEKTVSKVKDGRRVDKEEKIFPGYVLVEMIMDDDSWYVVRHTPGVTKFVGAERKPIPVKEAEIKRILHRNQSKVTKVEIDVRVGDKVKIISGPFADFVGDVTEVYPDKEKLRANVSIFGRDTPVELEYNQIQKV